MMSVFNLPVSLPSSAMESHHRNYIAATKHYKGHVFKIPTIIAVWQVQMDSKVKVNMIKR